MPADADPGTHAAIDWLLRTKWDLGRELDSLDRVMAGQAELAAGRNWFVNTEGVTMAVVRVAKPLEFEIGSPEDEDGRDSDERIHTVRLDRSFAIATREVTAAQFERFLASEPRGPPPRRCEARPPSCADCPVLGIDWMAAAAYCNWLSRRENLQPYYLVRGHGALGASIRMGLGTGSPRKVNGNSPAGPARARLDRTATSEEFLVNYAWFLSNATKRAHPVGALKPNDLGLFDMLGNAFEWTEDRYTRDSAAREPGISRPPVRRLESPVTGRRGRPARRLVQQSGDLAALGVPRAQFAVRPARDLWVPLCEDTPIGPRERGACPVIQNQNLNADRCPPLAARCIAIMVIRILSSGTDCRSASDRSNNRLQSHGLAGDWMQLGKTPPL